MNSEQKILKNGESAFEELDENFYIVQPINQPIKIKQLRFFFFKYFILYSFFHFFLQIFLSKFFHIIMDAGFTIRYAKVRPSLPKELHLK